jgi:hypothetical protein
MIDLCNSTQGICLTGRSLLLSREPGETLGLAKESGPRAHLRALCYKNAPSFFYQMFLMEIKPMVI